MSFPCPKVRKEWVAVLVNYEDMPIAHHPKYGDIVPNVIVAMLSVITR